MTTWDAFVESRVRDGATIAADVPAPLVGCYDDVQREYRALGSGPALVDRSYRGLIEVTGADRAAWLHNLTTNEVKNLTSGEGQYAFALSVQGRILFDLNVLVREEAIWIDIDRRFVAPALTHFGKYIITEDVVVTDRTGEFVRLALAGEGTKDLLRDSGAPHAATLPWLGMTDVAFGDLRVDLVRHDFCGVFAVELFVPTARAVDLFQSLTDASGSSRATPVGDDAVQVRRVEAGVPWPFCEITDEYLPAETGQVDRAVNIHKGCYLGQEVVERMRSRGALARKLVGLTLQGDEAIATPVALADADGKPVGQLTSSKRSFALEKVIGLGYVKTASASVGASLQATCGDRRVEATVTDLPFVPATAS